MGRRGRRPNVSINGDTAKVTVKGSEFTFNRGGNGRLYERNASETVDHEDRAFARELVDKAFRQATEQ